MPLVLGKDIYAIGGGTVAHASDLRVRILRGLDEEAAFDVEHSVWWLSVSPNGSSVLIYESTVPRVWRWRANHGLDLWATSGHPRDIWACGFLDTGGEILTLLAQGGSLRAFSDSGEIRFAANIRSPSSYYPRVFTPIPGGRLALIGHFFGDSSDSVVTVSTRELLHDPEAVQTAIRQRSPIHDRAIQIAVGTCAPDAAVAYRDPEGDEEPDEEAAEDNDLYGFTGLYVRQLDTGVITERHAWTGAATSYSNIVASSTWIGIQVQGGLDMVDRHSGQVHHIPAAVLDPVQNAVRIIKPEGAMQSVALDDLLHR